MKNGRKWFRLYADHPKASNLSIAGGALRLLAIFLMAAAIPCTLALLLSGFRITMAGGVGTALILLMDELDDELLMAFFLWGMAAASRYAASVLQEKAELLVGPEPSEAAAATPLKVVPLPDQETKAP